MLLFSTYIGKTELYENGNFCLFATANFRLSSANGKWKTEVCFPWSANDKRSHLLFQQTFPSMHVSVHAHEHKHEHEYEHEYEHEDAGDTCLIPNTSVQYQSSSIIAMIVSRENINMNIDRIIP
jgi:hypothetical protein